jgi:Kdo2-lipid IVA lauroyltransferase/acyltransferase
MSESPKNKKKKKHHPLLDWLLYAALRVLVAFLCMFPIEANLNTACALGRLMWKFYHRGRQRALDNLRASFPDKDQAWLEAVGKRSFEQIVMLAVDILFTPRLVKTYNWRHYARFINIERPKQMMVDGHGLLLVTGHYGNFEILGYLMAAFGLNIYSIARPLDNKYINEYLLGVRERTGQKIIDKKGASDLMEKIASDGFTLGFIADQDAGKKGIFVDFFGRKASTYKSIGLLAVTYNMPVVIGCTRRVGNRFFFECECTRIIMPQEWQGKDNPLVWVTQEYTKAIEDGVRKDPSQYWWLHRRWKTRPKEERAEQEIPAGT